MPLNRFPQMMQEYLVARMRSNAAEQQARKLALRTRREALADLADTRRKMRRVFGRFPRRTPLKPVITGVLERDGYRVEKILFESRPGLPVTGNLYVPVPRKLPAPGVLVPCGHSHNGKAYADYQRVCLGLAKKGYVAFIYDPLSQGERLQYPDGKGGSRYGVGVGEHVHAGNQQLLLGEFFGSWRVWDGIRALDYLLSRPEVDPRRVGLTGNSGGGTLTALLLANDDRFTVAAPSCYITTEGRNAENELPADNEQIPPGLLALGMDEDDLLACHAPKPLIILAQDKDFFDVRGTIQVYERLKHLYTLLGVPDNVALHIGSAGHSYNHESREAMHAFFNRACGCRASAKDPDMSPEPDEELQVTPTGQVADLQPRTVFSFTLDRARSLAAKRRPLRGPALNRALARLLNLPKRSGPPEFRVLRPWGGRGYPKPATGTYVVESEPGVQVIVTMLAEEWYYSRPPHAREATVYVSHDSADAELREEGLAAELAAAAPAFFAVDVRGVGDSRPNSCGEDTYLNPYGCDFFYSTYGLMLDEPYLGRRTHDVLSVLDFLAEHGCRSVHLAGCGRGSLPALFAAVLDDRVKQVTLKNCPLSYQEMAEDEDFDWPLSSLLPNVLQVLDLPDCYRALKGKRLRIIEPWDARRQPMTAREAKKRLADLGIGKT